MREELSRIVELVTNLCGKVREDLRKHQTTTTLPQGVMLYWFVKAAKTYDALLLLWREGYWQDAVALSRTLFEIVLQSKYLSGDPAARAELFVIHDQRARRKMLKKADDYNDPSDTDISDLIKSLRPTPAALESWRNWWGKDQNIRDLAKSVGLEELYDGAYGLQSVLIHSAPPGTSFYLFGTGDTIRVDWKANPVAPEKEEMAETFIASASTYIMDIVDVLGTIYGFDYKKDLEEAAEAIKQFRKH
jgi:hypothetical protein